MLPLVVDLDGTLTPTDTLVESVFCLLKKRPLAVFLLLVWLFRSRAQFKCNVAAHAGFEPNNLPWREDLLAWLHAQRLTGRRLVLATAAHESIANAVANKLALFDLVLASTHESNLKGDNKLAAIRQHVGSRFVYAGDSNADVPIWLASESAILVNASTAVTRQVKAAVQVEKEFAQTGAGWRDWLRALRVYQWIKNLLIFVPLFTAFALNDGHKVFIACLAFLAFSLAASATYVLNDLWDLDNDRQHPRKKSRPFASGKIPIVLGVTAAGLLLASSLALALVLSVKFAGMVLGYICLTTAYSVALKHYVLIDVLMLALLYTFRVLAGAVATGIVVTPWLLAFSVFTFFSLALVKRCAELVSLRESGGKSAHGRDYQVSDLVVLWPMGIGASLCSVVVFGLYIGSPGATTLYGNTDTLWLVGIGLIYWIARLWIKTARGEMHDDPIVFAVRDFGSRVTVLTMLAVTAIAHFIG